MKKVLLATTILAASAGFAAADVTVSGTARMGVIYDGAKADNELSFTNRVRIIFTASGETDGGLSFGASVRADNADEANDNGSTGTVFISGAFGTVTMGDVDDAFGALFGDIAGVGLTGLGDLNELSSSADGGAFGIPTGNGLGLPGSLAVTDLFAVNANGYQVTDGAIINGAIDTVAYVYGPLFNATAVRAQTLPLIGTPTLGSLDATDVFYDDPTPGNSLTGPAPAGTDTVGFQNVAFANALVAGFSPAAGSDLLEGLKPLAAASPNADYVMGNVLGVSYVSAAQRAAFFAGTDYALGGSTSNTNDNWRDILIDTDIAVNLTPIDARALYTYALDGFGFALGASQTGDASAYSIGASYEASGFKVALAYARADWDKGVVASVTATGQVAAAAGVSEYNADGTANMRSNTVTYTHGARAEDVTLGLSYTMDNLTLAAVGQRKEFTLSTGANIDKHHTYGVSAEYKMDAIGVSAFYSQTKSDALGTTADNYGIGASYDLGGGASVVGGIVSAGDFAGGSETKADLGVSFTF